MPDSSDLKPEYQIDDTLQDFFEEKTQRVIKRRRQSGLWGGLCAFFGTDEWGWESYEDEETRYVVNFENAKTRLIHNMEGYFCGLEEAVMKDIRTPINENINAYFCKLKRKVENLRGDFLLSIQAHGLEEKKKEQLYDILVSYQKMIPEIQHACIELKKDLDEMLPGRC